MDALERLLVYTAMEDAQLAYNCEAVLKPIVLRACSASGQVGEGGHSAVVDALDEACASICWADIEGMIAWDDKSRGSVLTAVNRILIRRFNALSASPSPPVQPPLHEPAPSPTKGGS